MARKASYKPPKPRSIKLKAIKLPKLKSLVTPKIAGGFATKPTKLSKGITQDQLIKALSKIKETKVGRPKTSKSSLGSLLSRLRVQTGIGRSPGRFKL